LTRSAPPTVRLFVALDLPDELCGQLLSWGAHALTDIPGVRMQRPEAMHVTLCFLGGQSAAEVDAIGEAMRRAVGARGSLTVTAEGAIWLPPRRPRVAAVQLGDRGELVALQGDVAAALADGGWYEAERRRFLAHVTVARIGRGGPRHLPELPAPPAAQGITPSVSLYRSYTGPSEARYEPLTTMSLLSLPRPG
jgi:2'-5' RNA ligase